MSIKYKFDQEKALEVLLYIADKCQDIYNALKVLYFADKLHLEQYGRSICGDSYVAMSHGPVPSGVYDMVKYVRGDGWAIADLPLKKAFRIKGYNIIPDRKPNLELLSESDIECLDVSIEKYGRLSFAALKKLSHAEKPYQEADENDFIPMEAIIKSLPNGDQLFDYLQS